MKITSGNKVDHEGIHESYEDKMKTFVRSTQEKLADWKTKTERKRFRFQNVQVERVDLSRGLTQLFCQNSDYESLKLIQDGINLEKKTTLKILEAKITNLPKKETPTVHKDSNIANMKTSVAEKSGHDWSANLVRRRSYVRTRIKSKKCYPLLLKTFEENGGVADGNKLDELEAVIGGELTRKQIVKWFHHQRIKCGFGLLQNRSNFSERAKSVLLHAFAKNFGFVGKTDEIEEALDGELTRTQILNWFQHRRQTKGIPSTE